MAISFKRYVDITSGVGAGATVRLRELIGRIFTTSLRMPPGGVLEAASADDVGSYFGTASPEYLRALAYFGFISKNITKAAKLSFARWVDVDVAARIFGTATHSTLSALQAITTGTLRITIGGYTADITAISFAAAGSLAAVAAALQTKIQAVVAGGTQFTGATVTFNAQRNAFELVSGSAVAADISVDSSPAGSIVNAMGWGDGAIFAPGALAQEPIDAFTQSHEGNDNFGSFTFIPRLDSTQLDPIVKANDALNVKFMFLLPADDITEAVGYYGMWANQSGTGVVLSPEASGEYDEVMPMALLAATDYTRRNSVQNYMYQQFALSPKVQTNALADQADAVRLNYQGRTQTAGQYLDFFQRGVLYGLPVDPVDMNVYANEMWFKDAVGARIMELLLALSRVSANSTGRSQLIAVILQRVQDALFNGTISVGKPLTITQRLYITDQTGDELAWLQVQGIGYWLDCTLQSYTTVDGRTEWKAVYTLIYSKDDAIRKVEGSHVLI